MSQAQQAMRMIRMAAAKRKKDFPNMIKL